VVVVNQQDVFMGMVGHRFNFVGNLLNLFHMSIICFFNCCLPACRQTGNSPE